MCEGIVVYIFVGPLLYDSGLVKEPLTWQEDFKCLEYGIGMTNIVARTTRSAAELSKYVY